MAIFRTGLIRRRGPLLWLLQGLFLLRVLGQIQVAFNSPAWLPPMSAWYSGLIPYPELLTSQILILMFMTVVSYDNVRRQGRFYVQSAKKQKWLATLSLLYFLIMFSRYVIQIIVLPETRWFGGGTIPIIFHFVLAGYIYLVSLGDNA